MNSEHDRDEEEAWVHDLFTSFREHVIDVVDDFADRVRAQVRYDESTQPSSRDVMGGALVELLNFFSWIVGAPQDFEDDDAE